MNVRRFSSYLDVLGQLLDEGHMLGERGLQAEDLVAGPARISCLSGKGIWGIARQCKPGTEIPAISNMVLRNWVRCSPLNLGPRRLSQPSPRWIVMDEAELLSPLQPQPKKILPSFVSVSAAVERAMKASAECRANTAKKGKTNALDRVDVLFGGFCSLMCGTQGHSRATAFALPFLWLAHSHSEVTVCKEPLELFFLPTQTYTAI